MKTISKSITEIKAQYEVVVIGSGYGGAIAASRLSRAGQQVCLLERGKEIKPGQFPNRLLDASAHMQIHSAGGHKGSKTSLFDFHIHPGISVLVGCGLGGTSLINANVAIKPEDRVMADPAWPAAIQQEYATPNSLLQQGYALAKDMLRSAPLPSNIKLDKLDTLQKSAAAANLPFYRLDINVNFDVDGPNHVGVPQKPCNLCGDCCSGCNNQAKNTLLMNYLPDAVNHGAEIFTEAQVSYIEKKGDKWHVHFNILSAGTEKFDEAPPFVIANRVVVSAGTLGSTEILLRSKAKGLPLSDKVGEHYSGNGDVLGFGYNTDHEVNGVGMGHHKVKKGAEPGPCITGVIDARNQPILNEGMIIEDAAIPGAIGKFLPEILSIESRTIGINEETKHGLAYRFKRWLRETDSWLRGPYKGAIQHTQTYLLMTHDGSTGRLKLHNDHLTVDWSSVGREPIFEQADQRLREATKALSGRYIKNPVWSNAFHQELVTVHPLGGCIMSDSIAGGVVNHQCEVYDASEPGGIHHNLYVMDGSVVPRSLGANPLFTISALSERACALMAAQQGWHLPYEFDALPIQKGEEAAIGIQFTETMRGFWSALQTSGHYQKGFDDGQLANESFVFTLTIRGNNVNQMITDPQHTGHMEGSVIAPGLSPGPLTATEGVFNLFVDDPNEVMVKLMKYQMKLISEEGRTWYFKGFKRIHHEHGLDEWPQTSTLYITLFDGPDDASPVLGQGILHIAVKDFAKQMTTMKAVNAPNFAAGLKAEATFGKFFARSLWEIYGGIFAPDSFYKKDAVPRQKRTLTCGHPEVYPFKTEDGVPLLLTRYQGGTKGPLLMVHGFSGNRLTFTIDTIEPNMAEYFYAHGYDVWVFDYRLSNLLPSSNGQHTVDEIARYDYPAAIEKIKNITGAAEVDVMAHCVGSISLFMALCNGMRGVRSVVSAQIAANFYPAAQVKWKAGLHVPQVLDALGIHSLTAYADANEGWLNKLYDKFMKLYADSVTDYCNDPTCHRMAFMFGPLYEHAQLNAATHSSMIEMFRNANMRTYEQLTLMIRKHHLTNAKGDDIYMPHLSRLTMPITFIHGEKNALFLPKSTLTTFESLEQLNGKGRYKHYLIPGYGHNDCMYGKNTAKDVFPLILQQFEAVNK